MNLKHWALFFAITLSANYVSATFLPFLGGLGGGHKGGLHGGGRRRSYDGWNTCNKRLHGFLDTNIDGLIRTFQSKYGGQCSLGDRELDNYSLRNVRAKFGNLRFGDDCHCNVEGGQAFIHFVLTIEDIVASFGLSITKGAGGILGQFHNVIFGIIGYFVNKILQCGFPSVPCDVVLTGDHDGFRLSRFQILESNGELDFLGSLAGHEDDLGRFSHFIFAPLQICISLFLNSHFRPIVESGVGDWDCDEDLFKKFGLILGAGGRSGGRSGGLISGGGLKDGDSGLGGIISKGGSKDDDSEGGESGLGGIIGGSRSGGHGRRTGGSGHGRRIGGRGHGGLKGHGRRTGGRGHGGIREHGDGGIRGHGRRTGGIRGHGRKTGGLKHGGHGRETGGLKHGRGTGGIRGHGRRTGGIKGHGRKAGGIGGHGRKTGGSGSSEESWGDESGYGESGDDESSYEESFSYESEDEESGGGELEDEESYDEYSEDEEDESSYETYKYTDEEEDD